MSSQPYCHGELDSNARQIRLVHILPGAWDDPISCELHTASLDSSSSYQTLSYVWGNPKITKPILLHGCDFEVTTNLYAALRRLRCATWTRVIWIDALCINQADQDERTRQVMLMGSIYKSCHEVIMWLGDGCVDGDKRTIEEGKDQLLQFPDSGKVSLEDANGLDSERSDLSDASEIIDMFSSNKHVKDLPCFTNDTGSVYTVAHRFMKGFDVIQRIMSSPYWSRIWVVQEIILPPTATVAFGSFTIPWNIVSKARNRTGYHFNNCCQQEYFNLSEPWKGILSRFGFNAGKIEETRFHQQAGQGIGLFGLLRRHYYREASDPRDKVYAVLSLVTSQDEESLVPDYAKDPHDLYAELTMHHFHTLRCLRVLTANCLRHQDYPSWVAVWGQSSSIDAWKWDLGRMQMYDYYAATKNNTLVVQLEPISMLKVEGNLVDNVIAIGEVMRQGTHYSSVMTCKELLEMGGFQGDTEKAYKGAGTWRDAYWRTICADIIIVQNDGIRKSIRRTQPSDIGACEFWGGAVSNYNAGLRSSSDHSALNCYWSVVQAITNRRFFVTREGFLGLGPIEMEIGDDVYVINGSNVPFVLRKIDQTNLPRRLAKQDCTSPYPMFLLVGACYVHGIMDGEACSSETGQEATSLLLC